jgi:hypothetical protein
MAEKTLSIKLSLNDKQFQSNLKKSMRSLKKFSNQMKQTGRTLSTAITLPVLGLGVASAKLASDFEESLNKVNVAFGQSSEVIEDFAKTTLDSFGIAEGSALEMAGLFGDMATSMGLSQEEAANMSKVLVGLAGDLASFKNIGIAQAQTALAAIFTGETESLKKLGIVMTEANLKSFALSKGMDANVKTMSQAAKVALRYQFILDKTGNVQGDFARTSDGVANSSRSITESLKELGAEVGVIILPLTEKLLDITKSLIGGFRGLSDENKKLVIKFAAFAAIIGPILIVIGSIAGALTTLIPLVISAAGGVATFIASFGGLLLKGTLFASGITAIADAMGFFNKEAKETEKIVGDFEPLQSQFTPDKDAAGKAKMARDKAKAKQLPIINSIKATSVALNELKTDFETLKPIVEDFEEGLSGMDIVANNITQSFNMFGNMIQSSFAQALQSTDGFFTSFIEGAKRALAAIAAQIASMLILNALLGGTGLGNLMGFQDIGGFGGIGQVLSGVGSVNSNSVGGGGSLRSMISTGGSTEVFGTISGADILLSSDRAKNNRNRTRGY